MTEIATLDTLAALMDRIGISPWKHANWLADRRKRSQLENTLHIARQPPRQILKACPYSLPMGARAVTALRTEKVLTIGELVRLRPESLKRHDKMGNGSLDTIYKILAVFGLTLGMSEGMIRAWINPASADARALAILKNYKWRELPDIDALDQLRRIYAEELGSPSPSPA